MADTHVSPPKKASLGRWGYAKLKPSQTVPRVRALLGFTQTQLAKKLGVARVTIARWENGITGPSHGDLDRLRELLVEHLVRRYVQDKRAARKRVGLSVKGPQFDRYIADVRRRMFFHASVMLVGGAIAMPAAHWCYALRLQSHVLKDVPVDSGHDGDPNRMLVGFYVGAALEAAVHGETLSQEMPEDEDGRAILSPFWQARLLEEAAIELKLLHLVANLPYLTSDDPEEWRQIAASRAALHATEAVASRPSRKPRG
jgi:transcriptional regulator with XRE-family HTH domain